MNEEAAEQVYEQVRERALVIVEFLAQTSVGATLSNSDRVMVEVGINAGLAALAEYLKEAGVLHNG